ncbi:HlyD family type I secretion periplasmic adaptor subunit [Polaromonas sp. YR568]|uniref:HlyD family type I secretion periplasmic adaptor subunit n=1 Tax=Polaromonas sp. YR568 TaxID=1855301 RepID=UPI0031377160
MNNAESAPQGERQSPDAGSLSKGGAAMAAVQKSVERLGDRIQADPRDFQPALMRLQDSPPSPLGRRVLWAALIFLTALLIWAIFGRLDIVAVAEGKLVPDTYLKIVQPTDAGVVKEILVKENQSVEAGQVLIRMDTALSESDLKALTADYHNKRIALRRIDAQLAGTPFLPRADEPSALFAQVLAQYTANRQAYENALAQERTTLEKARHDLTATQEVRKKLVQTLPHYRQQAAAYEKLLGEGFAGKLMHTDKQRELIEKEQDLLAQEAVIASAQGTILQEQKKIEQITADYRRQLQTERVDIASQLEKASQEMAKQEHRNTYLELKAPQDGVVKDLATHTVGTVTSPGTILMTLVPIDENLRAEVWVKNDDIGFIHPTQSVKVKVAAFTFQKYGMVQGQVAQVSADASEQGAADGQQGQAKARADRFTYKTMIDLKAQMLETDGAKHRLTPGMQVSAEIHLGTRSVLEYLLSPVTKAFREAARER